MERPRFFSSFLRRKAERRTAEAGALRIIEIYCKPLRTSQRAEMAMNVRAARRHDEIADRGSAQIKDFI